MMIFKKLSEKISLSNDIIINFLIILIEKRWLFQLVLIKQYKSNDYELCLFLLYLKLCSKNMS